MQFTKKSQV